LASGSAAEKSDRALRHRFGVDRRIVEARRHRIGAVADHQRNALFGVGAGAGRQGEKRRGPYRHADGGAARRP